MIRNIATLKGHIGELAQQRVPEPGVSGLDQDSGRLGSPGA